MNQILIGEAGGCSDGQSFIGTSPRRSRWDGHSPFPGEGTAALYVPWVVFDGTQGEELGDLHGGHGVLQILLIGEDQDRGISQSLWTEEPSPSAFQGPASLPVPLECPLAPLLSQQEKPKPKWGGHRGLSQHSNPSH